MPIFTYNQIKYLILLSWIDKYQTVQRVVLILGDEKGKKETKIIRQGSAAKGQCESSGFYWSPSFSLGSLLRGAGGVKEGRRVGEKGREERASGVPQTRARSNIYPVILVRVLRVARYMYIDIYTWDRTISTSEEHESRERDPIDSREQEKNLPRKNRIDRIVNLRFVCELRSFLFINKFNFLNFDR